MARDMLYRYAESDRVEVGLVLDRYRSTSEALKKVQSAIRELTGDSNYGNDSGGEEDEGGDENDGDEDEVGDEGEGGGGGDEGEEGDDGEEAS